MVSTALLKRTNLLNDKAAKVTLLLQINNPLVYKPGDHLGVFPMNRKELVDAILSRIKGVSDPDKPVELQLLKETHTSNGTFAILVCKILLVIKKKRFCRSGQNMETP